MDVNNAKHGREKSPERNLRDSMSDSDIIAEYLPPHFEMSFA